METGPDRTIPISIWKYARRLVGDPPTIVLGNEHCLSRGSGAYCFGVWAPGGEFVNLVHRATLATMDPRYENVRPDLTAMLAATSTFTVGTGMLFAFPGWRAVDATGRIWKGA
jgi:hypothetical protein